jgi:hypothetical protein
MVLLLLGSRPDLVVIPIGSMEDKMIEDVKTPIKYRNKKPQAPTTNLWARSTAEKDMTR